jgi:hypothetical protein
MRRIATLLPQRYGNSGPLLSSPLWVVHSQFTAMIMLCLLSHSALNRRLFYLRYGSLLTASTVGHAVAWRYHAAREAPLPPPQS